MAGQSYHIPPYYLFIVFFLDVLLGVSRPNKWHRVVSECKDTKVESNYNDKLIFNNDMLKAISEVIY